MPDEINVIKATNGYILKYRELLSMQTEVYPSFDDLVVKIRKLFGESEVSKGNEDFSWVPSSLRGEIVDKVTIACSACGKQDVGVYHICTKIRRGTPNITGIEFEYDGDDDETSEDL